MLNERSKTFYWKIIECVFSEHLTLIILIDVIINFFLILRILFISNKLYATRLIITFREKKFNFVK